MTEMREQPLGLTDQAEIPDARSLDESQNCHPSPPWNRERGGIGPKGKAMSGVTF